MAICSHGNYWGDVKYSSCITVCCNYLSGLLVYNKWEDEFITFKVHLHCCICDLPGKALVFLHKLFNGLFGCMVFYPFRIIVTIHCTFVFSCITSEGTVSSAVFMYVIITCNLYSSTHCNMFCYMHSKRSVFTLE